MLPNIKYSFTNWQDGMKIHKQHFVDSENAVIDAIRDTSAMHITNFNFGLLPPAPGDKFSLDIKVLRSQTANFKISLSACRAVTAGGTRIEISSATDNQVLCEDKLASSVKSNLKNNKGDTFLAVVTVDVFDRQPSGEPSGQESPPRNPFARPKFELHLLAEDNVSVQDFGAFHLPVARFTTKGEDLVVDSSYIPPCASIKSHPAMIQLYNGIGSNLHRIQEYSNNIVQKIVAKDQKIALAQNVKKLCDKSVKQVSSMFFSYRNILPHLAPVFIAQSVVQLANVLKVELDFTPEKEKEELLQYFKEWNDLSPAAFVEMLTSAMELEYNHYNIFDSFTPVVNMLSRWADLLEKLNELELIGRRKGQDFVVGKAYQEKKKGFSFLD